MATDRLSSTFAALADPTRRAILARLALGDAAVTELAEPFEMSLPAVSKHLKVLERARALSRGRTAQWRPWRIEAGALKDFDCWRYRLLAILTGGLERLDQFTRRCAEKDGKRGRKKRT